MNRLRHSLVALALLLCASPLFAVYNRFSGYVERGGQSAVANLTGSSISVMRSYPGAQVLVLDSGTANPATIYQTSGGTAKANPFTASSTGYYEFYGSATTYDVRFTSGSQVWTVPAALASNSVFSDLLITQKRTAIGIGALDDPNYLGIYNGSVAIGYNVLTALTGTEDNNVGGGNYTLSAYHGSNSAVWGNNAFPQATIGQNLAGLGSFVGYECTTCFDTTALGGHVLYNIRTGHSNTGTGESAGYSLGLDGVQSNNNVTSGVRSMYEMRQGSNNTVGGTEALYGNIRNNQIVDGTFTASPLANWTVDSAIPPAYSNGWTAGSSKASKSGNGTGVLSAGLVDGGQWINYIDNGTGATYTIGYTISDCTSDGVTVAFGGQSETRTGGGCNGTFTFDVQVIAYPTFLTFTPTANTARFSVSNVTFVLKTATTAQASDQNTAFGVGAGYMASGNSAYGVFIGSGANRQGALGQWKVAIGTEAALKAYGNDIVAIGGRALYSSLGATGSIGIGRNAGFYETGSDKLFIDNRQRASESDGRSKALIYGVFADTVAAQSLSINAGTTTLGGMLALAPTLFANLGTPANGTVAYCSNCNKATPCTSGGTGAFAKRLNGAWDCD